MEGTANAKAEDGSVPGLLENLRQRGQCDWSRRQRERGRGGGWVESKGRADMHTHLRPR